ncbi:MAG: permease-like cell division protein FtsX [Actinomycetota bacterium]
MAPRFDYFFKETAQGLKRNGIVAFAAMSTTFIAILLLGLALLTQREVNLIVDATGGKVEVAVFLADDISTSQKDHLNSLLTNMSEVKAVEYESKDEAFARAKEIFKNEPEFLEGLTPEVLPASFRVRLHDPEKFEVVNAQLQGQPGIEKIEDQHEILDRVFTLTGVLRTGVLIVGVLMLLSAAFLIANTVRMGLFARRKEIGIMKLVGATNWFIRIPFIIEGIVEGLIGAAAAVAVLFILKTLYINPLYGKIRFFPWIQTADVVTIAPILLGVGVLVSIAAGFVGMRRFLEI